ncbi:protein yellow isoform X1 [Drosophila teissieri]|uniref:protein yellow isoform X1 n=1 Tax=Drosophila teissieri TaxID=7243 RepID=UPI001CBA413D|nr:protein yellow isoform X1 [Drosophila teissieri]
MHFRTIFNIITQLVFLLKTSNGNLSVQPVFQPLYDYEYTSQSFRQNLQSESQFETVYEWKYLDFLYSTFVQRQQSILNGDFVSKNNLPLGIDVHNNRLFVTTPRWKNGVPASLGTLPLPPKESSPAIKPYPSWEAHGNPNKPDCSKLMSVYRTAVDKCNRIWLIDSGVVNATINLNQICPPKIVVYDLKSDKLIVRYNLEASHVMQDSLYSNIVVDIVEDCDDAHAIVSDVWRFGLVVYSLSKNRSWRVTNYNFYPDPIASDFNVYGLNFQWMDGVFGMSIYYNKKIMQRVLYFHPMASFKEFMVPLNLLLNETVWQSNNQEYAKYFISIGDRGYNSQSSTSGVTRNGIMFFTQVHQDAIGCWDTSKPYTRAHLEKFLNLENSNLIQFPNDLKVDKEEEQSVWLISNRLPLFLYSNLDYGEVNFRILKANVNKIIGNSICNPDNSYINKSKSAFVLIEEGQCY